MEEFRVKLEQLKTLADSGLITNEEYEKRKAEVLDLIVGKSNQPTPMAGIATRAPGQFDVTYDRTQHPPPRGPGVAPPPESQRDFQRDGHRGGRDRGHGNWGQGHGHGHAPIPQDELQSSYVDEDPDSLFKKHVSLGLDFDKYKEQPKVYGTDVPPPVYTFEEMNLPDFLYANIRRMKYVTPTPIQSCAIPSLLANRNTMGCAQTGSGKTATFLFPCITHLYRAGHYGQGGRIAEPFALIMAPTRELVQQIYEDARKFTYQSTIAVQMCYGRAIVSEQRSRLRSGCDILVATPGRLLMFAEDGTVSLKRVRMWILDEADRLLDMGFEPDIRKIGSYVPPDGQRLMGFFSATLPPPIIQLAKTFMTNQDEIFFTIGRMTTENIRQEIRYVREGEKLDELWRVLQNFPGRVLVFCQTKRQCDEVCAEVREAVAIHGDKGQAARERALRNFRNGSQRVLVATDVASRGLDIPDIQCVVNYDLPQTLEAYVHRIGRTGRLGNRGAAIAFYNDYQNRGLKNYLIGLLREHNQALPPFWASEMETERRFEMNDYQEGYGHQDQGWRPPPPPPEAGWTRTYAQGAAPQGWEGGNSGQW